MIVEIEATSETKHINFSGTVEELLDKLKISKSTVLVIKENSLLTHDQELEETDEIKILSVASGG